MVEEDRAPGGVRSGFCRSPVDRARAQGHREPSVDCSPPPGPGHGPPVAEGEGAVGDGDFRVGLGLGRSPGGPRGVAERGAAMSTLVRRRTQPFTRGCCLREGVAGEEGWVEGAEVQNPGLVLWNACS